jgi:hypothetical protein
MTLSRAWRGRQRRSLALDDARRDYGDLEHTRLPEGIVRASLLPIALILAGCHSGSRSSDTARDSRVVPMDSATAHRICEAPDSVVAGTKECVLRDQGVRPQPRVRPVVPPQP